ncbi:sodium-dependent transporter [Maricaulis sp.]|uniref:sodium-dependent transporter n=1 Tax=Maricaulis sp. TaxID=1486257 RepID=UPI0026057EFB|nr:sodium-dependent transporter [Maricaulis sp.]
MAATPAASHAHWSSRFAFIMAAVGSAVGLGNLWRFPFQTGENGGSAFVLIYIACVALIAFPVLMAEFTIGRRAQKSAVTSTRTLAVEAKKSGKWSFVGWVCMAGGFLVLTTYSVIAGQVMAMSAAGFAGGFASEAGANMYYQGEGVQLFWHALFMALTIWIVSRGLKGGIERVVTILMPLFFVMLAALTIFAVVRGFSDGSTAQAFTYLFTPDFSVVDGGTFVSALGQAFFSVGVASAIMITYGSYLTKDTNIGESAVVISGADTVVALVAGFMIFPIVFSAGVDPAAGMSLIFDTLPALFASIPAGNIIGGAFFFLAFIAALTSSISLLEATVAFFDEHSNFGRPQIAGLLGGFAFMIGAGAVYSSQFAGGFVDILSGEILLPFGGFLIAVFTGWVLPKAILREELSHASNRMFGFFHFMMRYVIPFVVGLVLVLGLDARFNGGALNGMLGLG